MGSGRRSSFLLSTGASRGTGDSQARICERLGLKFPGPARPANRELAAAGRAGLLGAGGIVEIYVSAVLCPLDGLNDTKLSVYMRG